MDAPAIPRVADRVVGEATVGEDASGYEGQDR